MDVFQLAEGKFWIIVIVQLIGFGVICFKLFAKSYSSEKGKNLATKEDIGAITEIVESIKTSLAIKTEELKSELSYKNEHLIHLRNAERTAIVNYYKATWILVLNFKRPDLVKHEIDNFDKDNDEASNVETNRYTSEAGIILNKLREDISNLKYLKDIAESELMFFYSDPVLTSTIENLNSYLSAFEQELFISINLLLQVFTEINVKIRNGQLSAKEIILEVQAKRSDILANWYEKRRVTYSFIITFNENLKGTLHNRLKLLTS